MPFVPREFLLSSSYCDGAIAPVNGPSSPYRFFDIRPSVAPSSVLIGLILRRQSGDTCALIGAVKGLDGITPTNTNLLIARLQRESAVLAFVT